VNPVTQKAYVLSYGDDTMSVIDGTSGAVIDAIRLERILRQSQLTSRVIESNVANQRTASVTVFGW